MPSKENSPKKPLPKRSKKPSGKQPSNKTSKKRKTSSGLEFKPVYTKADLDYLDEMGF